jgi:FkbM family methyltransferase
LDLNHAFGVQWIKNRVVALGPRSKILRTLLRAHGLAKGFRVGFAGSAISLINAGREIDLPLNHYLEVPIVMECFDDFFRSIEAKERDGRQVLDFARPGLHVYKRDGVGFYFPGLPEEDSMDAYTYWYQPVRGDIVWDAGAHAGATTYFLAKAVGPEGCVYAFEPDEANYKYLLQNIELHHLTNVIPVKKALSGQSGTVKFQSDGTMSSAIRSTMLYSERGTTVEVEAISLEDACREFGSVPMFVKMDIEGAEAAVIEESAAFLKENPIHFAIESYHPLADGVLTHKILDDVFPGMGYVVESSAKFGQMFTWARRP